MPGTGKPKARLLQLSTTVCCIPKIWNAIQEIITIPTDTIGGTLWGTNNTQTWRVIIISKWSFHVQIRKTILIIFVEKKTHGHYWIRTKIHHEPFPGNYYKFPTCREEGYYRMLYNQSPGHQFPSLPCDTRYGVELLLISIRRHSFSYLFYQSNCMGGCWASKVCSFWTWTFY